MSDHTQPQTPRPTRRRMRLRYCPKDHEWPTFNRKCSKCGGATKQIPKRPAQGRGGVKTKMWRDMWALKDAGRYSVRGLRVSMRNGMVLLFSAPPRPKKRAVPVRVTVEVTGKQ